MALVAGPEWSLSGLQVAAGRFPLAVEQHILRMVSLLVPGATTVTPHGRYYGLHALAAVEAADRALPPADGLDLLRRMEVVLGAISVVHEEAGGHRGFPRPHGADPIITRLRASGALAVAELSKPGKGGYVQNQLGFWAPYVGSEFLLGIITSGSVPTPGPRCDARAVRAGLGDLIPLAAEATLDRASLAAASHLCLCQGGAAADGAWLRSLLCDPGDGRGAEAKADRTRRATARLLARVLDGGAADVTATFKAALGFGPFVTTDPIASSVDEAEAWRGVVLRHYTVGAWRRLAWLVDQVDDLITTEGLASVFADQLPDVTVDAFCQELPASVDAGGHPLPAEEQVRANGGRLPAVELGVLAIGARRVDELTGKTGDAFRGRPAELAPEWVARRFSAAGGEHLRDFGRELVADLVVRARRIAMSKMVRRSDGTIWYPTRLHERGDFLWRTSREGSGDVGLRVAQFTTVLAGAGVTEWREDDAGGAWHVTDIGSAALA